jgi:osmotically inducible protein OsmC
MALSVGLEKAGFPPKKISTTAKVKLEKVGEAFRITEINLETEADVPGIDDKKFQETAEQTKKNCPVSVALGGTQIHLKAALSNR